MKKDSIADYLSCIAFRLLGPLIRLLPLNLSFFLGRLMGEVFYAFDLKHKSRAYAHIKNALGLRLPHKKIKSIARDFYRNFGQNIIEILLIPRIDKEYVDRYIAIEGLDNVREAFKKGKGVIILGVHAGSWELGNIISANLGYAFNLLVRDQRFPRLQSVLNVYRTHKGCKLIKRENQIGGLIRALKNNEAVGMTADQGGKTGIPVDFFGRQASMPTGAIRLALKYSAAVLPVYLTRVSGPYSKIIIGPPLALKDTGNPDSDLLDNLREIAGIFERFISTYPADYLWIYKIWKYAKNKRLLVLNDGKTGHLRQSQAVVRMMREYLDAREISSEVNIAEVKFKNKFSDAAMRISSGLSGKYQCQGCLWCLKAFLTPGSYQTLVNASPDVIISCGSSVAPVNYVLARQVQARSVVILRPSFLSVNRFDLVIMPEHDRPPERKNVAVTQGALNLITDEYLKEQREGLGSLVRLPPSGLNIGFLVGGDTRDFSLTEDAMRLVINDVKSASEKLRANILLTTSRRTSAEIEELIKKEFKDYPGCKLLIIANEKNSPSAVGGILALSRVVIVSPESISMISEAASSGRHVIVFNSAMDRRHTGFIRRLAEKSYIHLCEPGRIEELIERLLKEQPPVIRLDDSIAVMAALKRIL